MKKRERSTARRTARSTMAFCASSVILSWGATESYASPSFFDTSAANASNWSVTANSSGGVDTSADTYFLTTGFSPAVAITTRPGWIADNSTGTHGGIGDWTYFVFRQSFDLTGYDATTASLTFQWAADDSGEIHDARGNWKPRFKLNGGSYDSTTTWFHAPWPYDCETYCLSNPVTVSSGFLSGMNTIDFYVEGNGQTDGFSLMNASFTASPTTAPIPEPETYAMLLAGLGLLGFGARRRKQKEAALA